MKPITYYINFPLAAQIQHHLDELSLEQKLELAFAIGQRALDEKRSADAMRRDIEGKKSIEVVVRLESDLTEAELVPEIEPFFGEFTGKNFDSQGINFDSIDPADKADFFGDGSAI